MTQSAPFHCDVQKEGKDEQGNQLTSVKCHGRLSTESAGILRDTVKPLLVSGGRIIVDLADVSSVDSSGLGALVGLKVSAINKGYCILEFVNMTPRILDLFRITNLTQMLSK
ncbi:MAG: STAS domain-containing protein [Candidatus Acidiferrum sp.]